MKSMTVNNYFMNDEKEALIWKDCIFVFDTSALLGMYFFTKESQVEIIENVFGKLTGRLWIPQHVEFEYSINRGRAIKKPIQEKYDSLEGEFFSKMHENIIILRRYISSLSNKTKNNDRHPYINVELTKKLENLSEEFQVKYEEVSSLIKSDIRSRVDDINGYDDKDIIFDCISSLFLVGREYSFKEIMEVVQEGKIRYENSIPPGYMDGNGKKDGTQIYGDLIIWKQIIEYAKYVSKTIVFVTNDVKEDWCYKIKRSSEIRIERPKEDLIKEIKDEADVDFWMYTFFQFLYQAKKYNNTLVTGDVLSEAKEQVRIKVRVDGLYYYTSPDINYINFLGFLNNGKVFSASVKKNGEKIEEDVYLTMRWFFERPSGTGEYIVEGDKISFFVTTDSGKVEYLGIIGDSSLLLDVFSHVNGFSSSRKYDFFSVAKTI